MLESNVPNPLAQNPSFHTHKVFAAIGIILTVAIIMIGGIWYFVQSAEDKVPATKDNTIKVSTSSAKTKTATKSVTKDETSNWSTHTNTNYKFSFKYDKKIHGSVSEANTPNPEELLYLSVQIHGPVFNLVVSSKDKQSLIDSTKSECDEFIEIKQTTINEETSDQLVCRNMTTKEKFSTWFFSKFGYTYWMNGEEQIVQTFKFL